jgi:CHAT domain-containing protein/tetratricopeptide (TPR) repeat protein
MSRLPSVLGALGALTLVAVAEVRAQATQLVPGEPLTFAAAAGDVEAVFSVEADQYVHLDVFQTGADVVVTVLDPAGAVFRSVDGSDLENTLETISWTDSAAGTYTVRVHVQKRVAQGQFHILLDPPRPSHETDPVRLRGESVLATVPHRPPADDAERRAARARLERTLSDGRALGDARMVARAQMWLGTVWFDDDPEHALDFCLDAADYATRSADRSLEEAFACASVWMATLGHLEESIAVQHELLQRRRESGVLFLEVESLLNMATSLTQVGDLREAQGLLLEGLEKARASSDTTAEAFALAYLARLHQDHGDYQQALDYYTRSLAIPHPHYGNRARHLGNLASVQLALGDLTLAHATARQAVAFARRFGFAPAETNALGVLGEVLLAQGDSRGALAELSSNVALTRRNKMVQIIDALVALGRAEASVGRTVSAGRHYREALAHSRSKRARPGEVRALLALCALADQTGDAAGTADSCARALELSSALGYGQTVLLSRYFLARSIRRRGELHAARELLEQALATVAARRLDLRRADLRRTFSASVDDIEDEYVDLLVALADAEPAGEWNARAFEAGERSRGRSLRDELAPSRGDIHEGVEPHLLEEDRALRDRLRATLNRQLFDATVPATVRTGLERDAAELHARLAEVEARIRRSSPRYASISQPEPPTLDEIRAALLDDGAVLLAYSLGRTRSFLWVVTADSLERHVLPSRTEIDRLARRAVAASSAPGASRRALASLGRVLLTPAARRLDASRVVIVADGVLHVVPFAALPSPLGPGLLLDRSEVVHLPSASAGVLLARVPLRSGPSEVAVFADPVFRADDERVPGRSRVASTAKVASLPRELTRDGRLARLPFTRQEARAIQALAGSAGRVALDFDASREAALDERMSSYRFVHFATHGLLNASRPELSGIVLSLVDRTGRPQNGFLTALDTFNLRLDADLVVLSGCRTALGKDVRSEGIVGLTRGFMYAGARGVLASLWPVDDAATAELMRAFYSGLLGPRKLSPPAALREAQRHVRSDPRWSAPYYWAAFQLQGVWAADPRH